jgi:hypothetical protein
VRSGRWRWRGALSGRGKLMIVTVSGGAGLGVGRRGAGAGGLVVRGVVGATVAVGRAAVGFIAVAGGGGGVAVAGSSDEVGGTAIGRVRSRRWDSDVMTEAASPPPALTVSSPTRTVAAAAARLPSRNAGRDPRRSPTIPMPMAVRPAATSSHGSSPITSRTRRIFAHPGRLGNQLRARDKNFWSRWTMSALGRLSGRRSTAVAGPSAFSERPISAVRASGSEPWGSQRRQHAGGGGQRGSGVCRPDGTRRAGPCAPARHG